MPELPPISFSKEAEGNADSAKSVSTLATARLGGSQDYENELSAELSSQCSIDGSKDRTVVLDQERNENEPSAVTTVQDGLKVESKICNSQVTAGRDYTFVGNLTINNYEAVTIPSINEGSGSRRRYANNEDDIAAGMLVPPPPACILERESQHNQIVANLLAVSNARAAVLGMGGIGKTTLACSVANDPQIIEAYSRRLFLSFEDCSTADLAYTNLASVFQIPMDRRSSHRQILSQALLYLKAEKTLFILDNFETFWEVSSNRRAAEDFLGQLAALPKLAIVVTLRGIQRPGNIRWIKVEPLQTLTPDASKELLSIITDEDYTGGNSEYVHKLLEAVAGIPLAVTLIGPLLRDGSETPRSLWNQWIRESARAIRVANEIDSDDRLYQLDISLRLSIFSSRMSDNAKGLLAAISMLPSGLNLDEAWLDRLQNLLPSPIRIRDCTRTLRDVALATLDSSTSPPRLRLLPPIRDFCLNNLPLDCEISCRILDIYLADLKERWDPGSNENYTWVTTELSNATEVLNRAIALRYITQDFSVGICWYTEWRRYLCIPDTETVMRGIEVLADHPNAKASCLRALSHALSDLGCERDAITHIELALSIHREVEDKFDIGYDLYLMGVAHNGLKDYTSAEHYLSEARHIFAEIGATWGDGTVLQILAEVYLHQDKLSRAENAANEGLALCRAAGNRRGEGNALYTLGNVYKKQGKYDLAIKTLMISLDVSQTTHDIAGEAHTNEGLGDLYYATSRPDRAAVHLRLAATLFEQAQTPSAAARVRTTLEKVEESLNALS